MNSVFPVEASKNFGSGRKDEQRDGSEVDRPEKNAYWLQKKKVKKGDSSDLGKSWGKK